MASLKSFFKKYLISGLAVVVPLVGTYLILKFFIQSADSIIISLLPGRLQPEALFGRNIPGLGLIVTIIILLIAGALTRHYVGRKIVGIGDRLIARLPLGRGIYSAIKQFMQMILMPKKQKFQGVVTVEYPRRGCWVLGFVTRSPGKQILSVDDRAWTTVFIPTTPNPTSGFLIMVPEEETRVVQISTEDAFKFIISGGYVQNETPHPGQQSQRPLSPDSAEAPSP